MQFLVSSQLVVKISLNYQYSISSDYLLCGTTMTPTPLIPPSLSHPIQQLQWSFFHTEIQPQRLTYLCWLRSPVRYMLGRFVVDLEAAAHYYVGNISLKIM